jgi:disulfide bond formation protein DsbB
MPQTSQQFLNKLALINTVIGLVGVILILTAALVMQFFYGEQPCPLCLLQRAAFVSIGIALLMNLRYGNKVGHWALVILSAVAGIAVSIRQILLHVTDSVGYGSAVVGLHLYTWCFIGFALAIVGAAVMLLAYPAQ